MNRWLITIALAGAIAITGYACDDDKSNPEPTTTPTGTAEEITSTAFVVPVRVTPAPGFVAVEVDDPRDFGLERVSTTEGPDAWLAFMAPTQIYDPSTQVRGQLPADFADWLANHPGLDIMGGPTDVSVDGVRGVQIDATGATSAGQEGFLLWRNSPDGQYEIGIDPGGDMRFIVIDVDPPVVIAGGPVDSATPFEEVRADIEAMVASTRFE